MDPALLQPVVSVIPCADGRVLAVKGNRVFDLGSRTSVFVHTAPFTGVAGSSSNVLALADAAKNVLFLDLAGGGRIGGGVLNPLASIRIQKSPTSVAFSPTTSGLSFVSDRFGDVFRVVFGKDTGASSSCVAGTVSTITCIVACRAGAADYVIAADRDEKIRAFDGATGELAGFLLSHSLYVSSLCLLGQDRCLLASAGGDDFVCLWRLGSSGPAVVDGTVCEPLKKLPVGGRCGVLDMCPLPDSHSVALIFDNSATVLILRNIAGDGAEAVEIDCGHVATAISSSAEHVFVGTASGDVLRLSAGDLSLQSLVELPGTEQSIPAASIPKSRYRKCFFDDGSGDDDGDGDDGGSSSNRIRKTPPQAPSSSAPEGDGDDCAQKPEK